MSLADLPVLMALKAKLNWHQARQSVLAENVANADSPGFQPRDLKVVSFEALVKGASQPGAVTAMRTNVHHISMPSSSAGDGGYKVVKAADWETRPSGNGVALEEEMMKVTANQMDYQAAAGLYSRSLALLRIAIGQGG